jgi:C4-dicarboxylate transporter, DctM subunit
MTTAIVSGLIVFAFFGAPIFAVLGALAILGAALSHPDLSLANAFSGAVTRVFHLATAAEGSTLATIPLFTFMGYILAESRTAERLVAFAKAVVGWFPGGLAIVTIFVCAIFTTVTGASGVTIVAVGGLVLPALLKDGYSERFSLGLVTGTGSIGLLFPPALPLIIYGIIYGAVAQAMSGSSGDSIVLVDFDLSRFLLAGIVPGLVLCGAMALYSMYVALRDRVARTRFDLGLAVSTTIRALPELLIPVLMIVSLQLGLVIPEAAAVTALYVVVLETLVYRDVKLRALPRISREAMQLVGAIFILIVSATALTDYFVYAHVPDRLTSWMVEHIQSKYVFLIALNILLLAVGFVMEIFSALLVVVPLIAPAAAGFGIDPYHLGVIFLLNLEIGYVHPPVGLNLFISSFRFRVPMVVLYRAIVPFIIIMLITLFIVTYVPQLSPVKARKAEPTEVVGAAPGDDDAAAAAAAVRITLPDGGVIGPEHCEAEDVKDDAIAYADCQTMFKMWARCEPLGPLDRLECQQKVLDGEDPFAEETEETEEP